MGKRKEKKREKGFPASWAGGISAQQARAHAGGCAFGPVGPATRGDGAVARARTPEGGRGGRR
jgi:anti-sigma factor RsiW